MVFIYIRDQLTKQQNVLRHEKRITQHKKTNFKKT